MRGRGAGADSCFPRTHSPLPPVPPWGGTPRRAAVSRPAPHPPAAARRRGSVLGRACRGGRAPPPDGGSRTLPRSRRVGSGTPGTMPRLGRGWPAAPRLSPASAAVLLGVLCLPGAPASSLLTGTAGRGLRGAHLRRVALAGRAARGVTAWFGAGEHRSRAFLPPRKRFSCSFSPPSPFSLFPLEGFIFPRSGAWRETQNQILAQVRSR